MPLFTSKLDTLLLIASTNGQPYDERLNSLRSFRRRQSQLIGALLQNCLSNESGGGNLSLSVLRTVKQILCDLEKICKPNVRPRNDSSNLTLLTNHGKKDVLGRGTPSLPNDSKNAFSH